MTHSWSLYSLSSMVLSLVKLEDLSGNQDFFVHTFSLKGKYTLVPKPNTQKQGALECNTYNTVAEFGALCPVESV